MIPCTHRQIEKSEVKLNNYAQAVSVCGIISPLAANTHSERQRNNHAFFLLYTVF
jgi:hypothetical protein